MSLLIANTPAGKHFRVEGSSVRQGFSFVVRPHCSGFALGPWVVQRDGLGMKGSISIFS